ncbi:hypothetical protein [Streptomyces scabiei]|uniref:hypothetical protein n=1 Tax=Streptomyces scabiei TaxID=1930 RepID=UPI0029AF7513|nr:hypothetical protein [Streptomyces scabiei]MDX3027873.1 hypothetical protein [Streptomyces scabiei]
MTLPIHRLDVDLHVLVDRLTARRLADGAAAEQRHLLDPADRAFAALACACPTACACPGDYPGWTPTTKEKTS